MGSVGAVASGRKIVVALDFDGVVCNSVGESARSAFHALQTKYPQALKGTEWEGTTDIEAVPSWLLYKMVKLRPVVETGYENILLCWLMITEYSMAEKSLNATRPLTVQEIIANWNDDLKSNLMRRFGGLTKEELVDAFGETRDKWIKDDLESWLKANRFYENYGIKDTMIMAGEAVAKNGNELYIVTTKQARFTEALLKHAGIQLPEDKIFGLGTGPKADILCQLMERYPGCQLHFVEDRVETLEGMCKDPRLDSIHMYLADWGYNTQDQQERGKNNDRIEVINKDRFREVMELLQSPAEESTDKEST